MARENYEARDDLHRRSVFPRCTGWHGYLPDYVGLARREAPDPVVVGCFYYVLKSDA